MIFFRHFFCHLLILFFCASCSTPNSKKDYGSSMQSVGGKAQELGDRWNEGGDLIDEGNKLIKQSQLDRVKGENMVKKGLQIQAESEKIFKETYQRVYQNVPDRQPEVTPPPFAR